MNKVVKEYLGGALQHNKVLVKENSDLKARIKALESENTLLSLFKTGRSLTHAHSQHRT